jgi:parallel beta-helix repeat protein
MKRKRSTGRKLRLEALENRRLLAVFTVDDDFAQDDAAARRFNTIQEAVNAAAAGDTIKVRAGTYEESVVVNKQLTIKGADPKLSRYVNPSKASIVDPPADNTDNDHAIGFELLADGIVIKGFTIGEFDGNADDEGTIGITTSPQASGYTIEDNVFEDNTIGIRLNSEASSTNTALALKSRVEDNLFRDNDRAGSSQGTGIISDLGIQNVVIEDNEFTGAHRSAGIRIEGIGGETPTVQSNITIEDNEFEDLTGGGIYWERVVDSTIEDNEFEDVARNGIHLNGANLRNTIRDNELEDIGTAGFIGIALSNTNQSGINQNNLIEDNEIENAGLAGLVLSNSNNNTVRDNEIEETHIFGTTDVSRGNGISLINADNNLIEDNEVEDNERHGIFIDLVSTGNTIRDNVSEDNNEAGLTGVFDYTDETSNGTGPSGVQNTYIRNRGETQNKTGLIATFT